MRDMAGKCSSVVEMCVKAEKEMNQEVGLVGGLEWGFEVAWG